MAFSCNLHVGQLEFYLKLEYHFFFNYATVIETDCNKAVVQL